MKRFFLIWVMILAGLTNYSRVSENCIGPLISDDHSIYLTPNTYLSEELFTIPADGTIFVTQIEDHLLSMDDLFIKRKNSEI